MILIHFSSEVPDKKQPAIQHSIPGRDRPKPIDSYLPKKQVGFSFLTSLSATNLPGLLHVHVIMNPKGLLQVPYFQRGAACSFPSAILVKY